MRVRAKFDDPKKFGWYDNKRRYDGDEFEIPEDHPIGRWMEVIGEKKRGRPKKESE